MSDKRLNDYVSLLKVLADDSRLRILVMLQKKKMTATEILKELNGIKQSTLSYHLCQMVDAGLLDSVTDWKWTTYSVNKNGVKEINKFFEQVAETEY